MTNSTTAERRIIIGARLGAITTAVVGGTIPAGELDDVDSVVELLAARAKGLAFQAQYRAAVEEGHDMPEPDQDALTGARAAAIQYAVHHAALVAKDALGTRPDPHHRTV